MRCTPWDMSQQLWVLVNSVHDAIHETLVMGGKLFRDFYKNNKNSQLAREKKHKIFRVFTTQAVPHLSTRPLKVWWCEGVC